MAKAVPRLLPDKPDLGHLRKQAKELLTHYRRGAIASRRLVEAFHPHPPREAEATLSDAQLVLARSYSFPSWPKLVRFVGDRTVGPTAAWLRAAIDADDPLAVRALLTRDPGLVHDHVVRGGRYHNQRALAYACQRGRLAVVDLLLAAGADPHADGDLAIARAAMRDAHLPIVERLLDQGVSPNAKVYDWGPLILYPCESLAPAILRLLLARGADPNLVLPGARSQQTPLAALLGTYERGPQFAGMIDELIAAGAVHRDGPVLDLHRGRLEALTQRLAREPDLVHRRFVEVDYGATGMRRLTARGGTLLHVAAEWCDLAAAELLLAHGADPDARAEVVAGLGGQTALFHALSQYRGAGLAVAELLVARGAERWVVATLPGTYDQPQEVVTANAWEYAARFPGYHPADLARIAALQR